MDYFHNLFYRLSRELMAYRLDKLRGSPLHFRFHLWLERSYAYPVENLGRGFQPEPTVMPTRDG